ncbi:MAG: HAD-IC family P-type ATPase [Syntrophomonadaceae bacterium]|nr:HAD-IC family P-type ATPase [Syntrophomonadaceae bacterium]
MKGNLVTIVQNGKLINIDEDKLRQDDIAVLQAGEIVPADLRLVAADGLEVDEFDITGEIMPVLKKTGGILYRGSRITRGTAQGLVVAAGEQTEYGQVLKQERDYDTPYGFRIFQKKYFLLAALLIPAVVVGIVKTNRYAAVIGIYLLLVLLFILLQNNDLFKYWLMVRETRETQIQIRDLNIFDRLNALDMVCFDKTGVLTTRQMEVENIYGADRALNPSCDRNDDRVFYLIKLACALCHDVLFLEKIGQANPVDKGLIIFAQKRGIDINELLIQAKRIYDQPFDSEKRYMACGFELNKESYYFAKGDPEIILEICNSYMTANGTREKADYKFRLHCSAQIDTINKQGDTALALAYSATRPGLNPAAYTFLGLLQLENSLQLGARETIAELRARGIKSVILTGDRNETAVQIAQKCGITDDVKFYLSGKTIARMELSELARQAAYCSVFARLLPSQKGSLIRLLQQRGHCIAMVGDGPNDGIALKVADIGISLVQNSSPVARRLAQVLITELADLPQLVDRANRIRKKNHYAKLFRYLVLAVLLLGSYGWVLLQ